MDKNFWLHLGVAVLLQALATAFTPEEREHIKRPVLKVFKTIKLAYADDPDFQ